MRKTLTILLLALLVTGGALAEVYEGTTAAMETVAVTSEFSGALRALNVQAGDRVEAGETLVEIKGERAFAAQDGSVSLLYAEEGQDVDGTVLELAPQERYLIYCTVDKAYQSSKTTLVHSGETVYVRCTSDGTHRAVGTVTQIEGEEYRVLTVGGDEAAFSGSVTGSAWVAEDGCYTVRILPEDGVTLPLGMSVTVRV